jgi:divalent metal cation (Fe/Co/Zn/Cd) transporter
MPDAVMLDAVRAAAGDVPDVLGVDKTRARKTGFKYHVDLHIEVDPSLTVAQSHVVAGRVRRHVRDQVAWVDDVLVHVEPAGSSRP